MTTPARIALIGDYNTACPHYDGEPGRRPAFHRAVANGMQGGFAADDGAALHFHRSQLKEVVSSRAGASAHRLERVGTDVMGSRVPARFLGPTFATTITGT